MNTPPVSPSGQYTPIEGGSRAFIPNPLPPVQPWKTEVVRALSRASYALGKLAATLEGKEDAPPATPFMLREAIRSYRLEGRELSLGEALMRRVSPEAETAEEARREVYQYAAELRRQSPRQSPSPLASGTPFSLPKEYLSRKVFR